MEKHSSMKNSRTEKSNIQNVYNITYPTVARTSDNFVIKENENPFRKKDETMKEDERWLSRYKLKAPASSDKEDSSYLRASGSIPVAERVPVDCWRGKVCSYSGKHKVVLQPAELKRLNSRLQLLEEEAKMLKAEFFGSMEERKELISELYQQFKAVRDPLGNGVIGETSHDGVLEIKEGRMGSGLSQVLCQESNPSLVTRDLRVNLLPFQESAQVMHAFSNQLGQA